jgi:hypothetical protein
MRELPRLELVLTMIAEIEAERDAVVTQQPYADKINTVAELRSNRAAVRAQAGRRNVLPVVRQGAPPRQLYRNGAEQ